MVLSVLLLLERTNAHFSGTTRVTTGITTTSQVTGNLQFNSGYGSVATAYGVRAWVSFSGQSTPSIRVMEVLLQSVIMTLVIIQLILITICPTLIMQLEDYQKTGRVQILTLTPK